MYNNADVTVDASQFFRSSIDTFLFDASISAGMGFAVGGPTGAGVALSVTLLKFFADDAITKYAPNFIVSPFYIGAGAGISAMAPTVCASWTVGTNVKSAFSIGLNFFYSRCLQFGVTKIAQKVTSNKHISSAIATVTGFYAGKFYMS
ncbi:hypothetical protein D5018_02555 [Parashewanella curva]|uniref:Uncharacterized protein n=1 Tax=Parashewanella curva TaxID=2338552 RepID=A0A3L8Q164_9GAMM|nr:hypothetical protein [Parashewanella curva]RLV61376.1 hypothetical protein D5018_02555 [Parashewanella curva]